MMSRATRWVLLLLMAAMLAGSCAVLKKNDCGCPPMPSTGKMKH